MIAFLIGLLVGAVLGSIITVFMQAVHLLNEREDNNGIS